MSDVCILMESIAYSGGLITARLSSDCNYDVFAFPGAVGRNTAKIATI
jgi:DNA protecting protein dprA